MDQVDPYGLLVEKRFLLREKQNWAESRENLLLSGFKGFPLQNDKIKLNHLQDSAQFF